MFFLNFFVLIFFLVSQLCYAFVVWGFFLFLGALTHAITMVPSVQFEAGCLICLFSSLLGVASYVARRGNYSGFLILFTFYLLFCIYVVVLGVALASLVSPGLLFSYALSFWLTFMFLWGCLSFAFAFGGELMVSFSLVDRDPWPALIGINPDKWARMSEGRRRGWIKYYYNYSVPYLEREARESHFLFKLRAWVVRFITKCLFFFASGFSEFMVFFASFLFGFVISLYFFPVVARSPLFAIFVSVATLFGVSFFSSFFNNLWERVCPVSAWLTKVLSGAASFSVFAFFFFLFCLFQVGFLFYLALYLSAWVPAFWFFFMLCWSMAFWGLSVVIFLRMVCARVTVFGVFSLVALGLIGFLLLFAGSVFYGYFVAYYGG